MSVAQLSYSARQALWVEQSVMIQIQDRVVQTIKSKVHTADVVAVFAALLSLLSLTVLLPAGLHFLP